MLDLGVQKKDRWSEIGVSLVPWPSGFHDWYRGLNIGEFSFLNWWSKFDHRFFWNRYRCSTIGFFWSVSVFDHRGKKNLSSVFDHRTIFWSSERGPSEKRKNSLGFKHVWSKSTFLFQSNVPKLKKGFLFIFKVNEQKKLLMHPIVTSELLVW